MPNTNTYTDVVLDWEKLLAAVLEHTGSLPNIGAEQAALIQALQEAKELKANQDSFAASRQQATQELQMILDRGREMAMRLRGAVKFKIGPRNERLVQFGIAPLRRRARHNPEPAPPPPPIEDTAGPQPVADLES
jgi:hypothetical protein